MPTAAVGMPALEWPFSTKSINLHLTQSGLAPPNVIRQQISTVMLPDIASAQLPILLCQHVCVHSVSRFTFHATIILLAVVMRPNHLQLTTTQWTLNYLWQQFVSLAGLGSGNSCLRLWMRCCWSVGAPIKCRAELIWHLVPVKGCCSPVQPGVLAHAHG